jgi:hypothetical protein
MAMKPKVFVSAPMPKHLGPLEQRFLEALERRIADEGLDIVESDRIDRLEDQARKMRDLQGLLVVALRQWQGQRIARKRDEAVFPTEFNHVHMALAAAARKPILVLRDKGVDERGALKPAMGCRTIKLPANLDAAWFEGPDFKKAFQVWLDEVRARSRLFLGYCSKSQGTAAQIQLMLERAGVSVINWAMDFSAGASILGQIEDARTNCSAGVFLFTEDDPLEGTGGEAAPRDNVVFETGYFMSAKGSDRCLIVRVGEAKMPADLGGAIYVSLKNADEVPAIAGRLASFVAKLS